jgi:hypothetical protein
LSRLEVTGRRAWRLLSPCPFRQCLTHSHRPLRSFAQGLEFLSTSCVLDSAVSFRQPPLRFLRGLMTQVAQVCRGLQCRTLWGMRFSGGLQWGRADRRHTAGSHQAWLGSIGGISGGPFGQPCLGFLVFSFGHFSLLSSNRHLLGSMFQGPQVSAQTAVRSASKPKLHRLSFA